MKKYLKFIPIFILILICGYIFNQSFTANKSDKLKVVFLDVGQGDSIFIETPNKKQILIDSGPDSKVLSSLSSVMPFADRSIDIVIITHHDKDHIGGLPVIIDNYDIGTIIKTNEASSSSLSTLLEEKVSEKKINEIVVSNKKRILLDNDVYLDIIFPDMDISNLEGNETSIVCRLVYGMKSFMFMGDADTYLENIILRKENISDIDSDVLKLGHHGSKTSSSYLWLLNVSPDVAIVSAGRDNRYGHPNKETIDKLKKMNIPYFLTYEIGNIIFSSDGKNIIRK